MSFNLRKPNYPIPCSYLSGGTTPEHYPERELPEFAFVGRSNSGKSTLINTLVGKKGLARTSAMPGRTQAIQFFDVANTLTFADLPGYGFAKAPGSVKREFAPMLRRYLAARVPLRGVVLIADIRRDPTGDEEELLEAIQDREVHVFLALSKADKLSKSEIRPRVEKIAKQLDLNPSYFFAYSGSTGLGRDAIWQSMLDVAGIAERP